MREQRVLHIEDTTQIERSKWVLDSPNPPPLWKKIFTSLKETLLPHGNKLCLSSKNKTFYGHAYSFLQNLFPILVWIKDYTASKFKDDLLAGLTLASLCIPQVYSLTLLVSPHVSESILLEKKKTLILCRLKVYFWTKTIF
jgi:low affinity sulfate transporter 2